MSICSPVSAASWFNFANMSFNPWTANSTALCLGQDIFGLHFTSAKFHHQRRSSGGRMSRVAAVRLRHAALLMLVNEIFYNDDVVSLEQRVRKAEVCNPRYENAGWSWQSIRTIADWISIAISECEQSRPHVNNYVRMSKAISGCEQASQHVTSQVRMSPAISGSDRPYPDVIIQMGMRKAISGCEQPYPDVTSMISHHRHLR
jgi:hypothetical protein